MGLSKYDKYRVTSHAKERYRERIDNAVTELKLLKDVASLMQNAEFLGHESNGTESWLHVKRGIVLIVDPRSYNVVTLYNSVESYENDNTPHTIEKVSTPKEDKLEEGEEETMEDNTKHPKVIAVIAESAKREYKLKEKEYFSALAPMYVEYGSKLASTAKTKRIDYFADKQEELAVIKNKIAGLEAEREAVLSGLKAYFEYYA